MDRYQIIFQATLKDLDTVYNICKKTIEKMYPSFYPKGAVDFFLNYHSKEKIKEDIEKGLKDSSVVVDGLKKSSDPSSVYGVNPDIIPSVISENKNGLGLGFKYAKENKAGIDNFLSIFGIAETNEEIYF